MKNLLKKINFVRTILTIATVCSIATFIGVFQILSIHNRAIRNGTKTDMNINRAMHNIDIKGRDCQDRLSILEEQIETLFEFHKKDKSQSFVRKLD